MSETINGFNEEIVLSIQEKKPVEICEPWPELLDSIFKDGETEGFLPLPGNDAYAVLHQTAKITNEIPSEVRKGSFGKLIISGENLPGNSFLMSKKEDAKYWEVVDAKRKDSSFFVKKNKEAEGVKKYKISVIEKDRQDYA